MEDEEEEENRGSEFTEISSHFDNHRDVDIEEPLILPKEQLCTKIPSTVVPYMDMLTR